jgi:hypothetical protein
MGLVSQSVALRIPGRWLILSSNMTGPWAATNTLAYVLSFSTRRLRHGHHGGVGAALGAAGLAAVVVGVVVLVAVVVLVIWLRRRAKRR